MNSISTIKKKILNEHHKEALLLSSKILGKSFIDFDEKFFQLLINSQLRSKMFDLLNMSISLQSLNYVICKKLEKKFREKFINWTYPQIRIDGKFAKKFSAPIHKDKWILDKNKKGYTVWFPLNKSGGSLLVSKDEKMKKIIADKYWGIKCIDKNIIFEKVNLKYGEFLIFDSETIHKSVANQNRISVQFRYEVLNKNFKKKTVNQVISNDVKKYWLKKTNN